MTDSTDKLMNISLPSDWRLCSLGEITISSQYGISSSSGRDCLVPILRMNNLQDGHIDLSDLSYIKISKTELESLVLVKGDLLLNRTNSYDLVGKTAVYDIEDQHVFASYLVRFRLSSSVLPAFINYYLNSDDGQRKLKRLATKAVSQANINPSILKKRLLIPIPSLLEQRRIVDILVTWDRAIELTTQLIAAKRLRKRGLMQQLLTGRRRFREFTNSKWIKRRLGDLFLERRETERVDLPLLSITANEGIIPRGAVERRDTSNEDKSKYLRICKGDIGYNTMRMWQGVSALSNLEGIVSPAYTICVPLEGVDAHFMEYLFKFPPIIHLFLRYSQGLVDDTLSLKFDNFAKIEVMIPTLIDEQKRIAEVLDTCDRELELLNRKLALLKKQKQGLMQQLLTGKVRVKV